MTEPQHARPNVLLGIAAILAPWFLIAAALISLR